MTREKDRETVTSARSGRVETIGDSQFLLLSNGQRLENSLSGEGLRISEFEVHGSKVKGSTLTSMDESPTKARSTLELLRDLAVEVEARPGRGGRRHATTVPHAPRRILGQHGG